MHSIRLTLTWALAAALALPLLAAAGHRTSSRDREKSSRTGTTTTYTSAIADEPGTRPGKRLTLVLKTGAGVRIRGWNKSEVRVSGKHIERACPDARIETDHSDEGVRVETYYAGNSNVHSCSWSLDIQVPSRYDLEIESAGGTVDVENLRGTIEGSTGGGEVRMAYVRGDVSLHTGGGDIHVTDSYLDGEIGSGGGTVKATRVDGGVRLEAGGKRYR